MNEQRAGNLVTVHGVDKVFKRGSEEIHVLGGLTVLSLLAFIAVRAAG